MVDQWVIGALNFFSALGVMVFAVSGAMLAAKKRMDILGFILIGTVTAIGGGTLRDLLLGIGAVNWVQSPKIAYLSIASATATYFMVPFCRNRQSWIIWMDAIGLAAFAVLGTEAAVSQGAPAVICIVMGVMSATFGGILRDVLCAEPLTLMSPELYISCALLASLSYAVLIVLSVNKPEAMAISFVAGFSLRAAAIRFGYHLPRFGDR